MLEKILKSASKVRNVLSYAQKISKWAKIADAIAKNAKNLDADIEKILKPQKDEKLS